MDVHIYTTNIFRFHLARFFVHNTNCPCFQLSLIDGLKKDMNMYLESIFIAPMTVHMGRDILVYVKSSWQNNAIYKCRRTRSYNMDGAETYLKKSFRRYLL